MYVMYVCTLPKRIHWWSCTTICHIVLKKMDFNAKLNRSHWSVKCRSRRPNCCTAGLYSPKCIHWWSCMTICHIVLKKMDFNAKLNRSHWSVKCRSRRPNCCTAGLYSPKCIHWWSCMTICHIVLKKMDFNAKLNRSHWSVNVGQDDLIVVQLVCTLPNAKLNLECDERTDGRTNGRTVETLYPLPNSVGRGDKKCFSTTRYILWIREYFYQSQA